MMTCCSYLGGAVLLQKKRDDAVSVVCDCGEYIVHVPVGYPMPCGMHTFHGWSESGMPLFDSMPNHPMFRSKVLDTDNKMKVDELAASFRKKQRQLQHTIGLLRVTEKMNPVPLGVYLRSNAKLRKYEFEHLNYWFKLGRIYGKVVQEQLPDTSTVIDAPSDDWIPEDPLADLE